MAKIDDSIFITIENKWLWRKDDFNLKTFKGLSNESELLEIVKPYLKGNKVIIQAGGNCGLQIGKFADFFDTVYTFEPEPINFHCLVANLRYDNVIKMQCCLGNDHNFVSMTTLENETGGFYVNQKQGYIPTLKIDDFNFNACDFLQLDVEGYQLYALEGAIETIKKFKPVISVEMDWIGRYNKTKFDIVRFLSGLGYSQVASYTSDRIFVYEEFSL